MPQSERAQTATEYLIILAVVIVIALIVVGVLGGIPGIGGGVSERQARLQLATEEVAIQDYLSSSLNTKLVVQNNKPESIKITDITINNKKCSFKDTVLRAGQKTTIDCFGVRSFSQGEKFSYPTELTYQDMSLGGSYTIEYPVPLVGISQGGSRLHTGQKSCYEGAYGMTLATGGCTSAHVGQDGYDDGTAKSFSDQGDNVLLDNHIGLYWTTNETADITRANAIIYCDGLTQGGFDDWRLPNINELVTVMNSGTTGNPSPNGLWVNDGYWSSTSQSNPYYWVLVMYNGEFNVGQISSPTQSSVRSVCVRGETSAISLTDTGKNFVDNGDGTVTDVNAGIVWQKEDSVSTMYWNNSVSYCNNLADGTGGLSDGSSAGDWRLPTVSEAALLIDYDSSTYRNSVFSYSASDYWTGTTLPSSVDNAYYLLLDYGQVHFVLKDDAYAVRCVRDHD